MSDGHDALPAPPAHQFWWLHDARWYQGVLKRFGQDAANEINAEAIKFVARRAAMWYRRQSGTKFDEIPMKEFVELFGNVPPLMWTDDMYVADQVHLGEEEWESVVHFNYALKMLRAARALDGYECPCLEMRQGWFEGLGVSVCDSRVECLRTGGEACRFLAVRNGRSGKTAE